MNPIIYILNLVTKPNLKDDRIKLLLKNIYCIIKEYKLLAHIYANLGHKINNTKKKYPK